MNVGRLRLEEFRSYRHLDLTIPPTGYRLIGRNASGKTTLLEAIVVLSTTRSPRTQSDRELINWKSGEAYGVPPFARLDAEVGTQRDRHRIEIGVQVDPQQRSGAIKTFKYDGQRVRAHDMVGTVKAVLFSPDDLSLVSGPPAERRRHLDLLLSLLDRDYLRALSRYNRLLAQRNGLLKSMMRNRADPRSKHTATELAFWDEAIIAEGAYVVAARTHQIARLSESVRCQSERLTAEAGLALTYLPRLDGIETDAVGGHPHQLSESTTAVAARYERQLLEARADEIRRGVTLLGPHRDDVGFEIDGRSLAQFGSRGQQRLGVVALKLGEAALIAEQTGDLPVLLLDDVLSELDEEHRQRLVQAVTTPGYQLLITSTDVGTLSDPAIADLPLARVDSGAVVSG
ncbi:MAG: DNA replication and repair protein RecF [Chloroflexota bacterium]|nr:DNA replication and repair protein RecF [Chloroflexota bacterium]